MDNFIQRKEDEFKKNLNDLQRKSKQNAILNIMGIIKDDQINYIRDENFYGLSAIKYIDILSDKLSTQYNELEINNE